MFCNASHSQSFSPPSINSILSISVTFCLFIWFSIHHLFLVIVHFFFSKLTFLISYKCQLDIIFFFCLIVINLMPFSTVNLSYHSLFFFHFLYFVRTLDGAKPTPGASTSVNSVASASASMSINSSHLATLNPSHAQTISAPNGNSTSAPVNAISSGPFRNHSSFPLSRSSGPCSESAQLSNQVLDTLVAASQVHSSTNLKQLRLRLFGEECGLPAVHSSSSTNASQYAVVNIRIRPDDHGRFGFNVKVIEHTCHRLILSL